VKRAFITLILFAFACDEAEEIIPDEPVITFKSLRFAKGGVANGSLIHDTVAFTFEITDGDGNFGLDRTSPAHNTDPFQHRFYVVRANGELVSSSKVEDNAVDIHTLLSYGDRLTFPYDTLPSIQEGCYLDVANSNKVDEYLYYRANQHFSNLHVKVMVREPDGSFQEFINHFPKACNLNYNGRITPIADVAPGMKIRSGSFVINMESSKKGVITYNMSGLWIPTVNFIGLNEIKVLATVEDRDLNRSNTIESTLITIE